MGPLGWTVLAAGYSAFEYWLGKTDRIKANSALGIGLHAIKVAGAIFFRGKFK